MKTAVFVISLKDAHDRRERFSKKADSKAWQFLDAKTALIPELDYVERDAILHKGRPLRKGELGCYASHYAIWLRMIEENIDQAIIMEDDAVANWEGISKLLECDLGREKVHFLKLFTTEPCAAKVIKRDFAIPSYRLVYLPGYSYGAVAYALTNEGARFFVKKLKRVIYPIDDALERSWSHGMPTLLLTPPLVHMEDSGQSSIGKQRFEEFAIPFHLRMLRFIYRVYNRLARSQERLLGLPGYRFWRLQ